MTKTGTGDVTVADGILNILSNVAFDIDIRSFITTKVKVIRFSNALFFYSNNQNGTTDIAISVAFEAGNIRYHNGTLTIHQKVKSHFYGD